MSARRWLGDTLIKAGLVTKQQLDEAIAIQNKGGEKLASILVKRGIVAESDMQRTLCAEAGIPFLADDELTPEPDAVALMPQAAARTYSALPIKIASRHLVVAMADPFDLLGIRALTRAVGRSVRVCGASRDALAHVMDEVYAAAGGVAVAAGGASSVSHAAPKLEVSRGNPRPSGSVHVRDESGPAAAAISEIVTQAAEWSATDIHIEPRETGVHVMYRIDGLLAAGPVYSTAEHSGLVARLKALAMLDAAETSLPQAGRARLPIPGLDADLRVSTFPTMHGEDIVLRLLHRNRTTLGLDNLGLENDDLILLRTALQRSHGLIAVSGPAGSGRTTTLYALASQVATGSRAVLTLEDPIEYDVPAIRQSQVNPAAGLTFDAAMRSLMRHDPDVLMVGSVRDAEAAQSTVSAALTGHLVLATVHAGSAAGVIPRLADLGIEPFVISSAVTMFVSQRLVRTLCPDCKVNIDMPPAVRKRFGLDTAVLFGPKGCDACRNTGYRGRVGVFEILPMAPDVAAAIQQHMPPDQIQRDSGRHTLVQDGIRKVQAGLTTLDELLRVTA